MHPGWLNCKSSCELSLVGASPAAVNALPRRRYDRADSRHLGQRRHQPKHDACGAGDTVGRQAQMIACWSVHNRHSVPLNRSMPASDGGRHNRSGSHPSQAKKRSARSETCRSMHSSAFICAPGGALLSTGRLRVSALTCSASLICSWWGAGSWHPCEAWRRSVKPGCAIRPAVTRSGTGLD